MRGFVTQSNFIKLFIESCKLNLSIKTKRNKVMRPD